jgi:YbgC/YbaW family acyl-CoA thioester hydrolase
MSFEDIVGFDDVDFARTPFYGRYLTWLERAWEAVLHRHGVYYRELVGERQIGVPVVAVQCRYLRPLWLEDRFTVEFRVERLDRRALVTEFRVLKLPERELTTSGTMERRFIDMRAFRGMVLPDDVFSQFEAVAAELGNWAETLNGSVAAKGGER